MTAPRPDPSFEQRNAPDELAGNLGELDRTLGVLQERITSLHSSVSRLERRGVPEPPEPDEAAQVPLPELQRMRDEVAELGERFLDRFEELVRRIGSVAATDPYSTSARPAAMAPAEPEQRAAPRPTAPPAAFPAPSRAETVRVNAGPFEDLVALRAFERGVASLPSVADVRLRSFHAGRAVLDVASARPAQLIEELHSLPTTPVATELTEDGTIVLTIGARAVDQEGAL